MASSSTSFHSTLGSSSLLWKYDVFLSFRGEDTRKTFVDHLHTRLVERGIHTYKDDTRLARGESIGPALLKAIQESRIAIIVFSKNYADSSWCLDELAHIMKCRDERGQIVLPVFYRVDPSDVRKQKRKYKKSFAKHVLENNNKVRSWRKALFDAGSLSGWVPTDIANGHEAELVKYIADYVSNTLVPLISNANEDLVGMSIRLQELRSRLEVELKDDVRMIGIWGMGGSGKTTLVSAIYDEISSKFDGCHFLENIREKSSMYGLETLQKQLLSDILKEKSIEVRRVEEGRRMIRSRLCHRKVLIVLDDVDHLDQLKMLAGSNDWFGEGSRIIITTRDNHLLNAHKVNVIYHNRLLDDDEAIKLFCKHAPQQDYIPTEDYEELSKVVVSYACGLPLALKVLGSFLCDKDINEWRSALTRLKHIPEDDIMGKLKISYDGLKPVEKELFLDIACFHRGESIEKTMVRLDACGLHPVIGIKVLIQKALITVSKDEFFLFNEPQSRFNMHDLIQEMGHYIVQGEHHENPEKHNRVWLVKDILSICSMNTTNSDKIEALHIDGGNCPQDLPHIVATMKHLRSVYWRFYPSSLLPRNFQPTKLCCLILTNSSLIELWEGHKILPNLKLLDISNSSNLIKTPDLGGLPCLERMILNKCYALREIHSSTGCHESLAFLDLNRCPHLVIFPPIRRMPNLATLILSDCRSLLMFPDIQTNMDSLVDIRLNDSGIQVLPSSIEQHCTNLVSLDLRTCRNLTSIEVDFSRLKNLKKLDLLLPNSLKTPAEDLSNADCGLEMLSLHPMDQRPPPFVFFHVSHSLTHLILRGSSILENGDIPFDICELPSLQVLDLSGNTFSRIHFNLVQLPHLKFLNIVGCPNLVELPRLPPSISVLETDLCNSLQITEGDFQTTYKWLWNVTLDSKACGVETIVRSMFQGNAINEDHFMSFRIEIFAHSTGFGFYISKELLGFEISKRSFARETFTLQLPLNWYSDYSGFLICFSRISSPSQRIIIKREMHTNYQSCLLDNYDKTKVDLVPRRSKGGSTERSTDCSEFGDEHKESFIIEHASDNSVKIEWFP